MRKVYADYSSTTYVKDEVLEEMLPYYTRYYGNPSSIYEEGGYNKRIIEKCRENIARILNADENEIYFVASGTEADNTAIKGIMSANTDKGNHIITTKIEHLAITNTCKTLEKLGYEVTYLDVDKEGRIDLEKFKEAIRDTTVMASVMYVNSEIGTIQNISQIGKICKEHNVIFHSDCVQAIGSVKIDVKEMNLDSISISAHKFYGPKGVGVLYVKDSVKFNNIIDGGHQEKGKRAGTENVAGIVGCSKALEIADCNILNRVEYLSKLRDYLMTSIINNIEGVKINGSLENRVCGNLNICIEGVDCNDVLILLNNQGICASCGSACSSSDKFPSYVLKAIGLSDKEAFSSIRFTLGEKNTFSDMDYITYNLKNIVKKLRKDT